MSALLDILEKAGYALDTPGAYTRGLLAGRPGERVGGREMLESWGAVGANQEGLDAGDVGGFLAEMLFDPLNLVGAGLFSKGAKAARGIKAANRSSEVMRAAGAMPEEIAKLTKAVDASGNPQRLLHGTPISGIDAQDFNPAFRGTNTGNQGFLGEGFSFTPDPQNANRYTESFRALPGAVQESGAVIAAHLDVRNPFVTEAGMPSEFLRDVTQRVIDPSHLQHPPLPMWGDSLLDLGPKRATDILKKEGYDAVIGDPRRGIPQEINAFDPSQIYSPYVAPAMQDVPSQSPLLAALLGHNAAVAPHRTRR